MGKAEGQAARRRRRRSDVNGIGREERRIQRRTIRWEARRDVGRGNGTVIKDERQRGEEGGRE